MPLHYIIWVSVGTLAKIFYVYMFFLFDIIIVVIIIITTNIITTTIIIIIMYSKMTVTVM